MPIWIAVTGAPSERAEAEGARAGCRPTLHFARRQDRTRRTAGSLRACRRDGEQRLGPARLCRCCRAFHHRAVRAGDAAALSAARGRRAIYAGLACSPCVSAQSRKTACTDNVCMRRSASTEVYAAVCESLPTRTLSRPPHEHRADRVVPHRAPSRRRRGPRSTRRCRWHRSARDADVRHRSIRANDHEAQQPGDIS